MWILHSRKSLPGLKQVDLDFCEICVYGKQKILSFLKVGKLMKSEKLELVHIDVWGPTNVSSLGGSHYNVTSLMMRPGRLGFIAFKGHLMCLKHLRNRKIWLRMRHV